MGKEFVVNTLEEMCDLMCNNVVPKEHKYKAAWIANPAGGCEWGFFCSYCGSQYDWEHLADKCPICGSEMSLPKTTYEITDYSNKVSYKHIYDKPLHIMIRDLYKLPYKIYDARITNKHQIVVLREGWESSSSIYLGGSVCMDRKVMRSNWEWCSQDGFLEITGEIDGCTDMEFVIGVEQWV